MNARDLEAPDLESQQLDDEDVPSEDVPSDEAELELGDLDDDELDPEDLDEDEDDLLGVAEAEEDEDDEDDDEEDEEDDEDDDEEDEEDDEDEDDAAVAGGSRRDGSVPVSLEEILARKPDPRRSTPDDDIMSVVSGGGDVVSERLPSRIAPMRERQEFVCKGCFLVKSRSQLADKARQLCRDCV